MKLIETFFDEVIGLNYLEKEMEITKSNLDYAEVGDKVKFKIVNYMCDSNAKVLLMVVVKPDMRMAEWNFAFEDDVKDSLSFNNFTWGNENRGPVNGLFYKADVLKDILSKFYFDGNNYYKE